MKPTVEYALAMAKAGYRVFPCKPHSKQPATRNGLHDATTDEGQIRRWWSANPDFGLAVACGQQPNGVNLLAVDVDIKSGGDRTWDGLVGEHGSVNGAPRHDTPSGGFHYFFDAPEGFRNTRNRLGEGIDTRGEGGYVVVPPTQLPDANGELQRYATSKEAALIYNQPHPPPAWIMSLLAPPSAPPPPSPSLNGFSILDEVRAAWRWEDELTADGWTLVRRAGGDSYWKRPGKTDDGHSAVLHASGAFVVFSTEAPRELERIGHPTIDGTGFTVSPVEYLAAMRFGGDVKALAREASVARGLSTPSHTDVSDNLCPSPEADASDLPSLPREFWESSDHLQAIYRAAKAEMVSPESLLVHVLCRVSALIPPCYQLPGISGSKSTAGTLDLMGCVVGASGTGKSVAADAAAGLVPDPGADVPYEQRTILMDMPPGSGEGLIDAFFEETEEIDDKGKARKVRKRFRHAVHMVCDEGNAFVAMTQRRGVTIVETMCSAWSGKTLGQTNAAAERRRLVKARSARFSAVLNIQEGNAYKLFDEGLTVVGFPGRLLFAHVVDPTATIDGPDFPDAIDIHRWPMFHEPQILTYDPAITREIKERRLAAAQGRSGGTTSQHLILQCKLAGVLTLWNGSQHVTTDAWSTAAEILNYSRSVLSKLEARHEAIQRDQRHARAIAKGEAEMVAESVKERALLGRAADRILLVLRDGAMAPSALSAKLTSQQRQYRDEAIEHLRQMGKVQKDADGRWALTP